MSGFAQNYVIVLMTLLLGVVAISLAVLIKDERNKKRDQGEAIDELVELYMNAQRTRRDMHDAERDAMKEMTNTATRRRRTAR